MDNNRKPKVLLVEDDLNLASLYASLFQIEGFEVIHCSDADKALQTGREFKPDLIMLDLMMPLQSGFDTLDLFRHTAETEHAKIIIMSAMSQPEDIEKTKDLGADDFIVKSQVSIDEVISRVRRHLGLPDPDPDPDPEAEAAAPPA